MKLKDYFEFGPDDRIRVKGSSIGIEVILDHFLEGDTPVDILRNYHPQITLEQTYASITYYLHNKKEVDAYLDRNRKVFDEAYGEKLRNNASEGVKQLRALRAHGLRGYLKTLNQVSEGK